MKTTSQITRFLEILPYWTAYQNGSRVRCEIGNWNFDGSFFIASGSGDGRTESEALNAAQKDLNAPFVGGEDALGLGYFND